MTVKFTVIQRARAAFVANKFSNILKEQYAATVHAKMSTAVQIGSWSHRQYPKQAVIIFNRQCTVEASCGGFSPSAPPPPAIARCALQTSPTLSL